MGLQNLFLMAAEKNGYKKKTEPKKKKNYLHNFIFLGSLIWIASCISCGGQSPFSEKKIEQTKSIDLNEAEVGLFSDLFDSVGYVLLKENLNVPLVHLFKTVIDGNNIYVNDIHLNNLLKFDLKGNHISTLKSNGSGPKEFIQIEDFQIIGDSILIYDSNLGKQIYFNQKFEFLKEIKIINNSTNFYKGNTYNLFLLNTLIAEKDKLFLKTNNNGEVIEYFTGNQNGIGKVKLLHGFIKNHQTAEISITIPFSYDLAIFREDGNLKEIKTFEFLKAKESENLPGQLKLINAFIPFSKLNLMSTYHGKDGYQLLFDQDFKLQYIAKNLVNDLDGLNYYFLPITYSKEFVVLYFPSIDLYNLYKNSEREIKEKFPNNKIHKFIEEQESEIKSDRHILVFLKIKEEFIIK